MMTKETTQNKHSGLKRIPMFGMGMVKMSLNSLGDFQILFQKGIGMSLIQNVIELYKDEILEKKQGNSIIPLDEFTIYLNYYESKEDDILVVLLLDDKEKSTSYAQLYRFFKKINNYVLSNMDINEIKQLCIDTIQIPKTEGIIAVLIIGLGGSPFFTIANTQKTTILRKDVCIGGFISALHSFSQEVMGEETGAKLKEINFGNMTIYMICNENAIFAYLVEKINPIVQRYMYLIAEEFIEIYKEHLVDFSGDVTPFGSFKQIINQYLIFE